MKPLVVFTFVALLAVPAIAGDSRPDHPAHGAKAEAREELRARVQAKIGVWLTTEIATRVGLDAPKSAALAESIRGHLQHKRERDQQLREELRKLRALVDENAADPQVKAQLDVVIGVSARKGGIHELVSDTARFLTVPERARLALAMPAIMQDLRKVMKQARREGRGKQGETLGDEDEL